jgi:Uma2 family endonuclease
VLGEIGLAIDEDRLIADLVVLPPGAAKANSDRNDVTVVKPALVVEVASRWTQTTDQGDKMITYAWAEIPSYWRVARDRTICGHRLREAGAYTLAATIAPAASRQIEWPFPITIEAAALATGA